MFELSDIDDLVVPRARSTTGRALSSMSRRRTFEACKALDSSRFEGSSYDAVVALEAAFAKRLPGDPHGIAHAISEPEVGVPLRTALGDPDSLPDAIERLLVRLGDLGGAIPGHVRAVHGRVAIRTDDPYFERCLTATSDGSVDLVLVRNAIERLRRSAPAMHDDLTRFAAVLVVSDSATLPPVSIGVGLLRPEGDESAQFEALVGSIVRGKLYALVEGRVHDVAAREVLLQLATEVALGSIDRRPARGNDISLPAVGTDDPLRFVVAELTRRRE